MNSRNLTPDQQAMVEMWERHTAAEFEEEHRRDDGDNDVVSLR